MPDNIPVDPYVLQLASSDVKESFAAIQVLKNRGAEAIPLLLNALKGEDPSIRTMSVIVLGELGSAAAVSIPVVVELLKEENDQLQMTAALTLVRIGASSIPALIEAIQLEEAQESRRLFWAAWALSLLQPSSVTQEAIARLNDVRENGRTPIEILAAEEALSKIIAEDLK